MDVADLLIDKILTWVDLQKKCAKTMETVATELEKHKKNVNISQVAGSAGSVVGAAALTGAGVATFFTAGLALPVIAGIGAVVSGLGLATSVGSDVVNIFLTSHCMKEAKKTEEDIDNLEMRIHKLMELLKVEGKKRQQQAGSCRDLPPEDYVVEQILRAMAKRHNMELHKGISLVRMMSGLSKHGIAGGEKVLNIVKTSALSLGLLSCFVIQAAGKSSGKTLMSKLFPEVVASMGSKAAAKALGRVGGGAIGLVVSVPELIINSVNLNNCETEASQSLRQSAEVINSAAEKLKEELDEIHKAFKRLSRVIASFGNTDRSSSEKEILIDFAIENCPDKTVQQWLRENTETEVFFKLIDMFHLLKEKIDEEEKKNHSNEVDITFLAHGAITEGMIPASCLLPLAPITDVLLYSPWNCYLCVDAAYYIATGLVKPEDRDFRCSGRNCNIPDGKHRPTNLPSSWNSLKKAGDKRIPNIMLSPVGKPGDGAWKSFEFLTNIHGKPGRNHIIIPYILPGEKNSTSSDRVPFSSVTLALSLVLLFSRFQATIHLTACLGKMSPRLKLNEDYLEEQYAYAVNETCMTTSPSVFNRAECVDVNLLKILKSMFG